MGSWLLLLRHPTAATTEEKYIFQQALMYRLLSSEVQESHCPRLDRPYTMTGMVGSAQRRPVSRRRMSKSASGNRTGEQNGRRLNIPEAMGVGTSIEHSGRASKQYTGSQGISSEWRVSCESAAPTAPLLPSIAQPIWSLDFPTSTRPAKRFREEEIWILVWDTAMTEEEHRRLSQD
ncbi:hypothetical protein Q7P36_005452 [Cladosporium allicinum]